MYEIQESNKLYNIFDSVNRKNVGYTRNKKLASKVVRLLKTKGFKGNMPYFFLFESINFDRKPAEQQSFSQPTLSD